MLNMFGPLIEIPDDYFASTLECVEHVSELGLKKFAYEEIFVREDERGLFFVIDLFKVRNDAMYKLTDLLDAFNVDHRYRTLLDGVDFIIRSDGDKAHLVIFKLLHKCRLYEFMQFYEK